MPFDKETQALRDIQENIEAIQGFVAELDHEKFKSDRLAFYGVVRGLEIVSEASRKLSPALKARHQGINWQDIADAGNVYRHMYGLVKPSRVWETVRDHLPTLLSVVRGELAKR
jgi:uncharacterized protein with HEPN domain